MTIKSHVTHRPAAKKRPAGITGQARELQARVARPGPGTVAPWHALVAPKRSGGSRFNHSLFTIHHSRLVAAMADLIDHARELPAGAGGPLPHPAAPWLDSQSAILNQAWRPVRVKASQTQSNPVKVKNFFLQMHPPIPARSPAIQQSSNPSIHQSINPSIH